VSSLQNLISPYSVDEFMATIYEKKWAHLETRFEECKQLFSSSEVEKYLFTGTPWLVKNTWAEAGMLVATAETGGSTPKVTSMEEVLAHYASGKTVILPGAQRRWPALARFCATLQDEMLANVEANVYLTPAGAQGFSPHYDMHDVLMLQVEGSKKWHLKTDERIPLTSNEDQLRHEYYTIDTVQDVVGAEVINLQAGQALYLPRGVIHYGQAQDTHSLHITFGFEPTLWYQLLGAVVSDAMLKDVELRKTVPADILCDLRGNRDKIMAMFERVLASGAASDAWRHHYRRSGNLLPGRGIDSINRIGQITADTKLVLREGASVFWDNTGKSPWFSLTGRRIDVPAAMLLYIDYVSEHPIFSEAELPDGLPGDSKHKFATWMVAHGLAYIQD
jgi:hypothetical protein